MNVEVYSTANNRWSWRSTGRKSKRFYKTRDRAVKAAERYGTVTAVVHERGATVVANRK